MICVKEFDKGEITKGRPCHGDSGGPLAVEKGSGFVLFGVASVNLASEEFPTMCTCACKIYEGITRYASVVEHRAWIIEELSKKNAQPTCSRKKI